MADVPKAGEAPKVMSYYAPGGGMMGVIPLTVLARVEELTGKPPAKLFQNMEGGSVSVFLVLGMNRRKSNDPSSPDYDKPYYTMKEGIKLFIDETPQVFPDISGRLPKMVGAQYVDELQNRLKDPLANLARKPVEPFVNCTPGSSVESLCKSFNESAVGFERDVKAYLQAKFGVRSNSAAEFAYDPKKLEALYKKVLGEDTRLSDSLGAVHLPAYNLKTQTVEFFSVDKKDLMKAAAGNGFVSHGDPKMWEVAMAATANNLAYQQGFILKDQVYFDGSMMHKPTSHRELEKKAGAGNVTLVNVTFLPPDKVPIGDKLNHHPFYSNVLGLAAALKDREMQGEQSAETLSRTFGNAIHGGTQGGLHDLRKYAQDMERMNAAPFSDKQVITIAPATIRPNEDPAIVPGFFGEAFSTKPEVTAKILGYANRMLVDQDVQIRALAVELLANQVRMGQMTPEEFEKQAKKIEGQTIKDSTVPAYLDELAKGVQKPEAKKVSSADPVTMQPASLSGMTGATA